MHFFVFDMKQILGTLAVAENRLVELFLLVEILIDLSQSLIFLLDARNLLHFSLHYSLEFLVEILLDFHDALLNQIYLNPFLLSIE